MYMRTSKLFPESSQKCFSTNFSSSLLRLLLFPFVRLLQTSLKGSKKRCGKKELLWRIFWLHIIIFYILFAQILSYLRHFCLVKMTLRIGFGIQRQNQGLPLQSFQTPKIKNKTNQGSASTFYKCPEIIGSDVYKKYRIFNKEPF